MKAVIDGKLYDTEIAELLFSFDDRIKTSIFFGNIYVKRKNNVCITKNGNLFCHWEAEDCQGIDVTTKEKLRDSGKLVYFSEVYARLFGEPGEG